jgi:membrane protein CcdC involved in cytochrome C biogenesis
MSEKQSERAFQDMSVKEWFGMLFTMAFGWFVLWRARRTVDDAE